MIFYCLSVLEFCSYSNEFDCYSHPDILFEAFSALRPGGLSEGEMLVKMLKIKDFYEFDFCSNTIVSMCVVCGNMSKALTDMILYLSESNLRSLAKVEGSHETYTITEGSFTLMYSNASLLQPFLGGSIIMISGLVLISSSCFPTFPRENRAWDIPLSSALWRASSTAPGIISIPVTDSAKSANCKEIMPTPQ